jgi:hypothetical protein
MRAEGSGPCVESPARLAGRGFETAEMVQHGHAQSGEEDDQDRDKKAHGVATLAYRHPSNNDCRRYYGYRNQAPDHSTVMLPFIPWLSCGMQKYL